MLSTGHNHLDDRIYYKEVISLLKKYGSVSVVAQGTAPPDYKCNEGEIKFFPLKRSGSILSRLSVVPEAIVTMIKYQPRVCHFHDFELIFALPLLRLLTRSKIIYDVHEVYPEMILDSLKIPRLMRPFLAVVAGLSQKLLAVLTDHVITTDNDIASQFNNVRSKVTTIFNYPRLSLFVSDEKKVSELGRKYKDRIPIIYNGGFNENKGLFLMIRAMEIIRKSNPEVLLLLLGRADGNTRLKIDEEIRRRNVEDGIEVVGWVPHRDVVNYISISRVGLIANLPIRKWRKNVPIKQFEYMACGVPVLGSDLPPVANYVKAAGCGKVFDPASAEALAQGIIDILKDEDEWRRMSESGRKAVREMWNWDAMEERLLNVYEGLLGR
ncbi:MAG: glycosyltransferase family 4 protein [Nitrospirae bacterium]|nr:glycosyltransferase family 4 protein [Nitrospirota bacterium]